MHSFATCFRFKRCPWCQLHLLELFVASQLKQSAALIFDFIQRFHARTRDWTGLFLEPLSSITVKITGRLQVHKSVYSRAGDQSL